MRPPTTSTNTSWSGASGACPVFSRISGKVPITCSRPLWMIAIRVHRRSTTSSTCEEKKIVTPFSVRRWSTRRSDCVVTASIPLKGSSRKSTRGAWISAQASTVFFRMPME